MGRMLKSVAPYWKSVIIIMALLFLQAFCDLSLPQYTSDIIDNGIQNGGVSHSMPESITKEEYETAKIFMTDEELDIWESSYDYNNETGIYNLNVKSEKKLDKYDDIMSMALIMNNQMSSVTEDNFRETLANQMGVDVSQIKDIPVEMLGKQMGVELTTFTKEMDDENGNPTQVTCVDMRQIFASLIKSGKMDKSSLTEIRNEMQKSFDTLGSTMIKSMGISYAKNMEQLAGMDMDKLQTSYLWTAGLKMVGFALLMAVTTVLVSFFASRVGAGVGRDLRAGVYKNVMSFSNAEIDKFSTASLITRTTNDVQQIQMVIVMMLRMVLYAPILGIGGIIKVTQTGAGMGWIIVLAVLLILAFVGLLMVVAMPKFKLMQKLVDAVNLVSREILTGLSVIRAFGREKKEEERFDVANRNLTKTMLFTNRVMTFMMPVMMFIMNGLSVLIIWVAAHKIDAGNLQVGAMTAFITYTMQIVMSFLMLTMMSIMIPRAGVAADRIDEVLKTKSSITDPESPKKIEQHKGVVRFEHVNFRYPNAKANALDDIDFVAEPGKTTAIIGSTGCGKSTLVNLIPRLYDVTDGKITLDGIDIRQLSMQELRDELGYVPQKGILFSGTIASNLRYGNEDATDDEIKEAATIAQADDFIEAKADRYESPIAQGGTNVSGGQKQRLSIARAIAKNPKVFIFDDSFSALDLKTDAALRKALAGKVKDSTVIIVAQRISTILHADQILVMEEGKIVGKGTHEELLKNCEVYKQIAVSQLSAKELGIENGGV
ncbi:MAG: ABC transporter ATP-binding protein/permease [Lachnospira sp.]|nr:ABC transporter ATP-binding protein/permease [Lachnospira sp.]